MRDRTETDRRTDGQTNGQRARCVRTFVVGRLQVLTVNITRRFLSLSLTGLDRRQFTS